MSKFNDILTDLEKGYISADAAEAKIMAPDCALEMIRELAESIGLKTMSQYASNSISMADERNELDFVELFGIRFLYKKGSNESQPT